MLLPLKPQGKILVLVPDRNSPPKRDFDGAFKPAAESMKKVLGAQVHYIPVPVVDPETLTIASTQKQVGFEAAAARCLALIAEHKPTHLVFCCHGWSTGLQLGFRSSKYKRNDSKNWDMLCNIVKLQRMNGTLRSICLFACSAGDEPSSEKSSPGTGNNSFADVLRDRTGVPVLAHWTVGHATRNPDLIMFDASDVPLVGGTAIQRQTSLYKSAIKLLSAGSKDKPNRAGQKPPKGDIRPAWLSLPLVTSYVELQALLSQDPE